MSIAAVENSPVWEPNAPEARLLADDFGRAALALRAHSDDSDRRAVVIVWRGVGHAALGGPNDEGLHEHELYDAGLRDLLWMGRVQDGDRAGVGHWILPLKECVVEVVAGPWAVIRLPGTTSDAVCSALGADWDSVEFRFNV